MAMRCELGMCGISLLSRRTLRAAGSFKQQLCRGMCASETSHLHLTASLNATCFHGIWKLIISQIFALRSVQTLIATTMYVHVIQNSKSVLLQFSQCYTPNKDISFCSEQRRHMNNRTQFRMLTVHFCTSVSIYTEHPSFIRTRLPYIFFPLSRYITVTPVESNSAFPA